MCEAASRAGSPRPPRRIGRLPPAAPVIESSRPRSMFSQKSSGWARWLRLSRAMAVSRLPSDDNAKRQPRDTRFGKLAGVGRRSQPR